MGAVAESLRMYLVCKGMKWAHLPNPGGIYAQHPKMLDDFLVIMNIEGKAEQRRREKEKREMERQRRNRK